MHADFIFSFNECNETLWSCINVHSNVKICIMENSIDFLVYLQGIYSCVFLFVWTIWLHDEPLWTRRKVELNYNKLSGNNWSELAKNGQMVFFFKFRKLRVCELWKMNVWTLNIFTYNFFSIFFFFQIIFLDLHWVLCIDFSFTSKSKFVCSQLTNLHVLYTHA